MECLMQFLQAALDELELEPEEVTEVEIEHSGFTNWCVYLSGTYVFFDGDAHNPYAPYTTVTPYEADELAALGIGG
jgi:hypothetical protein